MMANWLEQKGGDFVSNGSGTAWGMHLKQSLRSSTSSFMPKLPWETIRETPVERLKKRIKAFPLKMSMVRDDWIHQPHFEAGSVEEAPLVRSAFSKAGLKACKAGDERLWAERLSNEKKTAIKKWIIIILEDPLAWEIGRQQYKEVTMMFARGGLQESVCDALASRSSATLHTLGQQGKPSDKVHPILQEALRWSVACKRTCDIRFLEVG